MPKLVDWSDRFDDIRRAVLTITLTDGTRSITMDRVAAELDVSVMTVRRLMPSARHLPESGMKLLDRRALARLRDSVPGELGPEHPQAHPWNELLRELPCTRDRAEDARARRLLTLGFPDTSWSMADRNNHQLLWAMLADRAVPDGLAPDDRAFEVLHLTILVIGVIEAVATGAMGFHECVPLVRRHLERLPPACLDERPSGAA